MTNVENISDEKLRHKTAIKERIERQERQRRMLLMSFILAGYCEDHIIDKLISYAEEDHSKYLEYIGFIEIQGWVEQMMRQ
jgi:hypothetical protein